MHDGRTYDVNLKFPAKLNPAAKKQIIIVSISNQDKERTQFYVLVQ